MTEGCQSSHPLLQKMIQIYSIRTLIVPLPSEVHLGTCVCLHPMMTSTVRNPTPVLGVLDTLQAASPLHRCMLVHHLY